MSDANKVEGIFILFKDIHQCEGKLKIYKDYMCNPGIFTFDYIVKQIVDLEEEISKINAIITDKLNQKY